MRNGNFTGTLGKDWETKTIGTSGTKISENSLAVYVNKDKSYWVKLKQWGEKPSEVLKQYSGKGTKIAVSGEIDMETWTGQDGVEKKALVLDMKSFEFLTFKEKQESAQQQSEEVPF